MPAAPCSFPSVGKAVPEGSTVLAVDVDVDDEIARRRRRVTVLFGEANKFSHPFVGLDDDELHTILISCVELLLGSQDKISHPLAGVMSVMAYGSPHFFVQKKEVVSIFFFCKVVPLTILSVPETLVPFDVVVLVLRSYEHAPSKQGLDQSFSALMVWMVVVDKRKKRNGRRVCERLGVVGIGFCVESCFEKKKKKR